MIDFYTADSTNGQRAAIMLAGVRPAVHAAQGRPCRRRAAQARISGDQSRRRDSRHRRPRRSGRRDDHACAVGRHPPLPRGQDGALPAPGSRAARAGVAVGVPGDDRHRGIVDVDLPAVEARAGEVGRQRGVLRGARAAPASRRRQAPRRPALSRAGAVGGGLRALSAVRGAAAAHRPRRATCRTSCAGPRRWRSVRPSRRR